MAQNFSPIDAVFLSFSAPISTSFFFDNTSTFLSGRFRVILATSSTPSHIWWRGIIEFVKEQKTSGWLSRETRTSTVLPYLFRKSIFNCLPFQFFPQKIRTKHTYWSTNWMNLEIPHSDLFRGVGGCLLEDGLNRGWRGGGGLLNFVKSTFCGYHICIGKYWVLSRH